MLNRNALRDTTIVDAIENHVPRISAADSVLTRAEWQRPLFTGLNRAALLDCVPTWDLRSFRLRVHRNHAFEPVATATRAYAAWNGLSFEWHLGAYDETLSFDLRSDADVDVVWLDARNAHVRLADGTAKWLTHRVRALRSDTTNPIIVLAWPLSEADRQYLCVNAGPGTYVPDVQAIADSLGARWLDARAASLSGTEFSNRACLLVAREFACRWLPAAALPPKKAIALDLDGTLYDGVLAEDGPLGVKLSAAHRALHDRLRLFRDNGVLLALISHNALDDVEELFRQRPDFPLRLEDFSVVDVRWDDKAAAVHRAANALRIDIGSMIYVDDNPGELCAVAESSGIVTVHASVNATETVAALDGVAGLFRWHRAPEDHFRAEDLRSASERMRVQAESHSSSEYLRSLQVHLDFLLGPTEHLARLAELSAKTSQFNLALARLNEAQIARKLDERPSNVLAIRLADRLSKSGIVGLVVTSRRGRDLEVQEVCVSCRALGRGLEDSMVTKALILMAEDFDPDRIVFVVQRGPRNEPARQWFAQYTGCALTADTQTVEMPFRLLRAKSIAPEIHVQVWR